MATSSRNYGIDLFRICSMFCVIILHVIGHGNALSAADSISAYAVLQFFEVLAIPSVDCFVLISGYVGYRDEKYTPNAKTILTLYFTVFFYSVVSCLVFFFLFSGRVESTQILKSCLPVLSSQYWFYTQYFGLLLFSPILNTFVHKTEKNNLIVMAVFIFASSFVAIINDLFRFYSGYSLMWFILLYLLGAIVRKTNFAQRCSKSPLICLVILSYLLTWLWTLSLRILPSNTSLQALKLNSYVSPTILFCAFGLLCLFSKYQPRGIIRKMTVFFSPAAFSVYLIHDNRHFRHFLIENQFVFLGNCDPLALFILVPAIVSSIFVMCALLDKLRAALFQVIPMQSLTESIHGILQRGMKWFIAFVG